MKRAEKLLKKFFNMLFILGIVFFVWFLLHYKLYIVASGSMQPTLAINELIIVKKDQTSSDCTYKAGDIITYYDKEFNASITHRIVECKDKGYLTQGDNNNICDKNIVLKEQIIGKVVLHSKFLGYVYVNYRYCLIFLIIFSLIMLNIKAPRKGEIHNEKKNRNIVFTNNCLKFCNRL